MTTQDATPSPPGMPQGVVVTPEPARVRLSPPGFHYYASDFLRAGKAVAEGAPPFSPVAYYLFARSIELSIKAYLVVHRVSERRLKSKQLGHNLEALLTEAIARDLLAHVPLSNGEQEEIRRTNRYYSSKVFEYFTFEATAFGYPHKPQLHVIGAAADTLVTHLKQLCADAANDV